MDLFTQDESGKQIADPQLDKFLDSINVNRSREYLALLVEPSSLSAYEDLTTFIREKYPMLPNLHIPFLPEWQFSAKAEGAMHVNFHPRFEIPGAKGQTFFVIERKHVSVLDLTALSNELRKVTQTLPDSSGDIKASLPGSDFDALLIRKASVIEFRRRPEAMGESLQRIQSGASSVFHATLRSLDPDKSELVFFVYADSFEEFYTAREVAWQARFDVDWVPMKIGDALVFSIEASGNAVQ